MEFKYYFLAFTGAGAGVGVCLFGEGVQLESQKQTPDTSAYA